MSLSGIETGLLDRPTQTLSLIDRLISVPILCFKPGYDRGGNMFSGPVRLSGITREVQGMMLSLYHKM